MISVVGGRPVASIVTLNMSSSLLSSLITRFEFFFVWVDFSRTLLRLALSLLCKFVLDLVFIKFVLVFVLFQSSSLDSVLDCSSNLLKFRLEPVLVLLLVIFLLFGSPLGLADVILLSLDEMLR